MKHIERFLSYNADRNTDLIYIAFRAAVDEALCEESTEKLNQITKHLIDIRKWGSHGENELELHETNSEGQRAGTGISDCTNEKKKQNNKTSSRGVQNKSTK